jgi:DNA replication protein DnaC
MEQLKTIIENSNISPTESAKSSKFELCENCGKRPRKYEDGKLRDWCGLCIARFRFEQLPEYKQAAKIAAVIPERYVVASLDDLPKQLREKLAALKETEDLLLWGPVGCGKTHALSAMGIEYIRDGYTVKRERFSDILLRIRSSYTPAAKETEYEIICELVNVGKLIIEDIGATSTEQETDFALRVFTDILDKRQERLRPTLMSSNKPLTELGKAFGARIKSRLSQAVIIQLSGKDRRNRYET